MMILVCLGVMCGVLVWGPAKVWAYEPHVERAHRTHNEEFYEVTPDLWALPELNRQLRAWENTYNTVRPHQALGYATPLEFLQRWKKSNRKDPKCH